jgi:hypothetical protein
MHMSPDDETQILSDLQTFLDDYRNAVFAIAQRHDKTAIIQDTQEATRSGRSVFTRLVRREPVENELESLLALERLEEQCRKFQS